MPYIQAYKRPYTEDIYGNKIKGYRHSKCNCPKERPCSSRFRCGSPWHKGNRSTPYCFGCDDELEAAVKTELCDECWFKLNTLIEEPIRTDNTKDKC